MLKKRFLCACALLMILISLFSPGGIRPGERGQRAYTLRAGSMLADARTVILKDAGHGFKGEDRERAARESAAFVQEILTKTEPDALAAA